mmetsp:Transcript_7491/g.9992  ORF Transcript_7491/g.9992 Transcript_7491/m.9992 type:complete len:292 (-) Transcript_7491:320-1195(-)|eukprot:CAMPEP_0117779196 /NCGR_PEP_ID=MMETSP0948-20121206/1455_1 /TAXON_ID=44440 /ORGANISM="Chattonella subsalsa, Strain CCMP2191" /LENGTH=291 /DNA_ID=CAMNT_0005606687 /DNA_START=153 /DNA_END=1028 /DNA_ORIENTATION=-
MAIEIWRRKALQSLTRLMPWEGNFHKYQDLAHEPIPWGFIDQTQLKTKLKPVRQRIQEMEEFRTISHGSNTEISVINSPHYPDLWKEHLLELNLDGMHEGLKEAYSHLAQEFCRGSNFFKTDICSPPVSRFLGDVNYSLRKLHQVQPVMHIKTINPKVCGLWVERQHVPKNRYFLGLMGSQEMRWHLRLGMAGPETAAELESLGMGPRKLVAEVMYDTEESCIFCPVGAEEGGAMQNECLEDKSAKLQHKVNFITFESDWNPETNDDLEWVVTNINDVLKPVLHYRIDALV